MFIYIRPPLCPTVSYAQCYGVLLKLSGGDGTMSHPGSVKRGDHIESTCCWRHMGRIRHRVFDWGKFLTLTAEEDEHEAVVL